MYQFSSLLNDVYQNDLMQRRHLDNKIRHYGDDTATYTEANDVQTLYFLFSTPLMCHAQRL